MQKKWIFSIITLMVAATSLVGCTLPLGQPTRDPGAFYTQAASTIIAELTYAVVDTAVAQATQDALASPTPTLTNTPEPTATPEATSTPTATDVPPTNTPVPIPCNALEFVSDITIDDGEVMSPNEGFNKVWRLRNIGTCTWTTDYELVFVDGNQMDGDKSISLTNNVSPGRTIDVSVYLTAPSKKGTYTGYWMLRSSGGSYFGWGANRDNAFYVKINVKSSSQSSYDTPFYFADDLCLADWENDDRNLPCPGDTDSTNGWAIWVKRPWLEKGGQDDEPALVMHPEYIKDGRIRGIWAPINIEDGDTFVTALGCIKDEDACNVDFILRVKDEDGNVDTLGTWNEKYDKNLTNVSIDLSDYADQKVTFYFIVDANGTYKEDTVFWLNPQIR